MATADGEISTVVEALALGQIERASRLLSEGNPLDLQRAAEVVIDKGQYEALKFVLSNYKLDVDKHFLLHRALVGHQEDIARLLVESGADVNNSHETGPGLRDHEEACAHYSCYLPLQLSLFCSLDMTRFLLDFGADVNKWNESGETTLVFASPMFASADPRAFLLENEAKVIAKYRDEETTLHWAARLGYTEKLTLLIDHGADIEAKGFYGCTALMWACRNSEGVDCLKILLEKGADYRAKNFEIKTGLHLAAKSGNSMAHKQLIQYGAQLEARTRNGDTALILACGESVPAECVRILLENGAFPNVKNADKKTPLSIAKETKNEEKIQMLLQYGATEEDRIDQWETNLMQACRKTGNVRSVLSLLENNISPNVKNHRGQTALHLAVVTGDIETLMALVQYKADVNAMTDGGKTPLMLACASSSVKVKCVQLLLENQALRNVTDIHGDTALHWALCSGENGKVEILVQYGADVNARGIDNQTPLMLACGTKTINTKCVQLLLENHALPNVTDINGGTALHWALCSGDNGKVEILVQYGADVNARGIDNQTPLMLACGRSLTTAPLRSGDSWRETVKLLVEHGADLEVRTLGGRTPFLIAVQRENFQVIKFLHDLGADVCAEDVNGQNAIMLVIERNHRNLELLQYLIDKGVSVNHRDKNGWSPLMLVAVYTSLNSMNCLETLKCLLNAGADVHAVRTEKTEVGRREITLSTSLSIMLDDMYWDRSGCAEELIRRGAVNSLPERYNGFLHQMIWAFRLEVIHLLLTNGMAPTMSDSIKLLRFSFTGAVSPLTVALFMYCRNIPVIQYLLGNLMLCPCDIYGHSYFSQWRHRLISENKTDVVTLMDEFYSQPKSLFQLSFVTVSHALGGVPGRVDRVNSLPLPSIVKDKLLFKSIDVPLDFEYSFDLEPQSERLSLLDFSEIYSDFDIYDHVSDYNDNDNIIPTITIMNRTATSTLTTDSGDISDGWCSLFD